MCCSAPRCATCGEAIAGTPSKTKISNKWMLFCQTSCLLRAFNIARAATAKRRAKR